MYGKFHIKVVTVHSICMAQSSDKGVKTDIGLKREKVCGFFLLFLFIFLSL